MKLLSKLVLAIVVTFLLTQLAFAANPNSDCPETDHIKSQYLCHRIVGLVNGSTNYIIDFEQIMQINWEGSTSSRFTYKNGSTQSFTGSVPVVKYNEFRAFLKLHPEFIK